MELSFVSKNPKISQLALNSIIESYQRYEIDSKIQITNYANTKITERLKELVNQMDIAQKKLSNYKNIEWIISPAEKLPLPNNAFDFYAISFGLRNTTNLNKALSEAYRVLKPGGRYLCLEFSKIQNTNLDFIYKNYSKLIPIIGQFVVGEKEPYEYLIKSIEQFINQEELIELMKNNNFKKCSYRNFSG